MILSSTAVFKLPQGLVALLLLLFISLTLYQIVVIIENLFFSWGRTVR